jgi:hypothetical protein
LAKSESRKHPLFYTKDGDLDFGWAILLACCGFGLVAFGLDAAGVWDVSVAAWAWYGSFTSLAFIAGAAVGRARLIAQSNAPGEVAKGIASALPEGMRGPTEYDIYDVR